MAMFKRRDSVEGEGTGCLANCSRGGMGHPGGAWDSMEASRRTGGGRESGSCPRTSSGPVGPVARMAKCCKEVSPHDTCFKMISGSWGSLLYHIPPSTILPRPFRGCAGVPARPPRRGLGLEPL